MSLQGYNGQKASFSRTITVKQIGHAILHIDKYDEDHLITLPSLHIEGLWNGSPFVELDGKAFIHSTSGYTSKVDFSGRGWFSGKKNTFAAKVYEDGKDSDVLYTADGHWTGQFEFKDGKGKKTVDSWDSGKEKTTKFSIADLDKQDPLESRRAWKKVADALNKGDNNTASQEKSRIENSQRELRKKEQAENREWERIFFTRTEADKKLSELCSKVGINVDADKTNGVWRFDGQKAKEAKSPYREGVMPQ